MGRIRVHVDEFSYFLTAANFSEKNIDLCENTDKLNFETDKITILVGDGIAVGDVRCVGGDPETIDKLKIKHENMFAILLQYSITDFEREKATVTQRIDGDFLTAHAELYDARASVNVLIEPLKTAQWLSQVLEGKKLLPQSLLCFLAEKARQQALQTTAHIPLTPEASLERKEERSIEYIVRQWENAIREYEKTPDRRKNDARPRLVRNELYRIDQNTARALQIQLDENDNPHRDRSLTWKIHIPKLKEQFPDLPELPKTHKM